MIWSIEMFLYHFFSFCSSSFVSSVCIFLHISVVLLASQYFSFKWTFDMTQIKIEMIEMSHQPDSIQFMFEINRIDGHFNACVHVCAKQNWKGIWKRNLQKNSTKMIYFAKCHFHWAIKIENITINVSLRFQNE